MLKDDLNHWTVGAVYVYKNETVDYNEAVAASLEVAGYDSDKYRYEIVSGLPGIRYPAAVVFSADGTPEFIIPVQKATAHAFTGEWPTAAENRSTVPSWRYRMAAMTAEPASRFIITAMLPEHQTPGFGTGWAFPIKREALEPGTYRLSYWELPELSP